jgi:hypothetical protein
MLCELRLKAIHMGVTFPPAVPGRYTTLPARDFELTSGKGRSIIFLSIFPGSSDGINTAFIKWITTLLALNPLLYNLCISCKDSQLCDLDRQFLLFKSNYTAHVDKIFCLQLLTCA